MHKLFSRKLAFAATACLMVCGLGRFASHADNRIYVDSDVSVSSAIERYIVSNGDVSAIEETTEDKNENHTENKDSEVTENQATGTDATSTDATDTDATTEAPVSTSKYPEYEGKAVVCIPDNVNIRAAADTESDIVGLISSGGVMIVMDKGEEWSLIASGDVIGYINNDFIAFGDEGAEYAYNNVYKVAVVNTTTLRVRLEPDTDSECVTLIPYGERYALLEQLEGWVYIEIDDALSGYVSDEYIDIVPASIYARPITEYAEPSYDNSDDASDDSDYDDGSDDASDDSDYDDGSDDASDDSDYDDGSDEGSDDSNYDDGSDEGSDDSNYDDGSDDASDDSDYDDGSDDASDDSNNDDGSDDASDDSNSDDGSNDASDDSNSDSGSNDASDDDSSVGSQIASFACQFVGNPYVYGGSSLTNGADCSGFTMAVYAHFNVSLPHGATMQSKCTTEVSLSSLQPGDLVYYDHGTGSIEHVGLYIGGNQIVHASTETTGIIISSVNYSTPFKATRPLN